MVLAQGRDDVRVIAGTTCRFLSRHISRALALTPSTPLADAAIASGHASLVKFEMPAGANDDDDEDDDI